MSVSPSRSVNLGSVFNCPFGDSSDDAVEIAWLPNIELPSDPSWDGFGSESNFAELMPNGWTRLKSDEIVDTQAWAGFSTPDDKFWLSQANHVFTALQISSDFQDYVVVDGIYFELTISTLEVDIPEGFLFLCAPKHFQTGPSSFKWSDCPAYWSLDPSGVEWLTLEDAADLGFPSLELSTDIRGRSWDATVYAGLRQFHHVKGFNPDSQDVAQYLGHKLYQVSGPFAHISDEDSDKANDRNETGQDPGDEELDNALESILKDNDEEYLDNTGDTKEISPYPTPEEFDAVTGSTLMDPDLAVASTHLPVLQEVFESIPADPVDLVTTSTLQDVKEVLVSSTFEDIVDSTRTDRVDLPIASAHQDGEEIPVSNTFKFVLNVQLTLLLYLALSWVLSEM
ncbi:hypothetical protein C8R45DRAFT_1108056 [Mycena sanguinolenta]|nr:hypothetical protein C8R45DRAFT_1108056 [Mycena sanguinolenta]